MDEEIIQTRTYDFDQMLLDQATQITHPAAIAPLIRMAKQAGGGETVEALQRVEKNLIEAEAAELERLRAAERKAKAAEYVEPAIGPAKPSTGCTGGSVLMGDGSVVAWDNHGPVGGYSIQN